MNPETSVLAANRKTVQLLGNQVKSQTQRDMKTSSFCIPVLAAALALTVASAGASYAQTYTDLFNFDGVHGASPYDPELLSQGRDGNLYGTTPSGGKFNGGVVFRVTQDGSPKILRDLTSADGDLPYSGLTLGTDGDFYGTAFRGGLYGGGNGDGTAFKITPNGILTNLHSFNSADPSPQAPPIQAADGYFYGTSGKSIYKISSSGTYTYLASIPGNSSAPLVQATDGSFYGTTWNGGLSNNGTVFKLAADGTVKTVVSLDSAHGSAPYAPLIQASDGNFYGTTIQGGINKGGVVFELTPQGVFTVLHNFPDPTVPQDGQTLYAGLLQATDGNFYGVAEGSSTGPNCGALFEITPTGHYSILYNFVCTNGAYPVSTPMQHTNGIIYGLTWMGGTDNDGVVYSFNANLPPFIRLLPTVGASGGVIDILGQGFTSATSVTFNGTAAAFKVVSDTFLEAIVPSGASTGVVSVITPGGVLNSNQAFQVKP